MLQITRLIKQSTCVQASFRADSTCLLYNLRSCVDELGQTFAIICGRGLFQTCTPIEIVNNAGISW